MRRRELAQPILLVTLQRVQLQLQLLQRREISLHLPLHPYSPALPRAHSGTTPRPHREIAVAANLLITPSQPPLATRSRATSWKQPSPMHSVSSVGRLRSENTPNARKLPSPTRSDRNNGHSATANTPPRARSAASLSSATQRLSSAGSSSSAKPRSFSKTCFATKTRRSEGRPRSCSVATRRRRRWTHSSVTARGGDSSCCGWATWRLGGEMMAAKSSRVKGM